MIRRLWANEKLLFSRRTWENVCFSDESKFCLSHTSVQFVRRPVGERYNEKYLALSKNRSVGSVMVWGGFSYHSFTPLVRINGTLNAEAYIEILRQNFLPFVDQILPNSTKTFQHDNAPIHKAHTTKAFLQQCRHECN